MAYEYSGAKLCVFMKFLTSVAMFRYFVCVSVPICWLSLGLFGVP